MKISALRLHNVKRFAGRSVAIKGIGDGVNVLGVANQFGKAISFEALVTWRTVSCPLFIISYRRTELFDRLAKEFILCISFAN